MGCSSCSSGVSLNGHFGRVGSRMNAYVQASPAQIFTTTGQVISAPNETSGMHVNRLSPRMNGLQGMETYFNFSPLPTDWISGFPNGFLVVGGLALLMVTMTR